MDVQDWYAEESRHGRLRRMMVIGVEVPGGSLTSRGGLPYYFIELTGDEW